MVNLEGNNHQEGWRKGPWIPEEDKLLMDYVTLHGEGRWSSVSKSSGLNRSGKSCRLRWVNYLRPGLKRSQITPQEEGIIIELHALLGNKWSTIARYLPGRTDNEIKNYWRTHFKKKDKSKNKRKKIPKNLQEQQEQESPVQQIDQDVIGTTKNQKEQGQLHESQAQQVDHENENGTKFVFSDNNLVPDFEDHRYLQCVQPSSPVGVSQYSVAAARGASCSSDQSMIDEGYLLWGGLWNLDENPYGGGTGGIGQQTDNTSSVQSQGFPSHSNFSSGGCIF